MKTAGWTTFYKIYRRGSTADFHAIPYAVALFSATLMLYYAHLKGNEIMLIAINAFGCGIETAYLIAFFIYANTKARKKAAELVIVLNVGAYGVIILLTSLASPARQRVKVVGWICAAFSVCVFAAPLSIMRHVVRTKSAEFLPFPLSVCLTLSAIFWFCYGFFNKDLFVAMPNTLGFLFGIAQIVLYFMYRNAKRDEVKEREMHNNANESLTGNICTVAQDINNNRGVKEHERAELENGKHDDNLQQQENASTNTESNLAIHRIIVTPANDVVVEMPTVGNNEKDAPAASGNIDNV
ncbi:hypothetical protein L6164_034635 [Bauhinia variegata]|uniref:Uncharacterized protein n=1 Tax=Bauhinia variegata TaxID=167791 RepID=A0ACB9KVJ0_BAUVA|nr:hypothetical protein L6164_034635 [Bauhinia variegata]